MVFEDRRDAALKLAPLLERFRSKSPIVLGLARGGVLMAREISAQLGCEFGPLVVRKVGAPFSPEVGLGAVAPNGVEVVDASLLLRLSMTREEFSRLADRERIEVQRRLVAYTGSSADPGVDERTVMVVDDGLATGSTAIAAARYLRSLGAKAVILAVPVASEQGVRTVEGEFDEVVTALVPDNFRSVGEWYRSFDQVVDEDVMRALKGELG